MTIVKNFNPFQLNIFHILIGEKNVNNFKIFSKDNIIQSNHQMIVHINVLYVNENLQQKLQSRNIEKVVQAIDRDLLIATIREIKMLDNYEIKILSKIRILLSYFKGENFTFNLKKKNTISVQTR